MKKTLQPFPRLVIACLHVSTAMFLNVQNNLLKKTLGDTIYIYGGLFNMCL